MASERIEAWLRVRDSARFNAEMAKSSAAVSRLGTAAQSAGGLAASGLSKIGAASTMAVQGLGLAAGAAVTLGIKYNATMEQNEVAFANFLGSQKRAKEELDWLAKFAAKSPFELPDVIAGSRKLLAFGMSAKESREALGSIGEAAAGLGLAGPDINRMVMAIGQIQAKGKLSTEELLQMAELGVPAFDILKKSMHLTGTELEKQLRDGAISADKGIGILLNGMDKRFKGSMKGQANTFSGQMSTLKDNAMQMLGDVTKPLFDWLKDSLLPGVNAAMPAIKSALQGIGPLVKDGFGVAKKVFGDFLDAIKPAAPFLNNILLPLLKGIAVGVIGGIVMAFKIAIPVLKFFFVALGWIGTKFAFLKPVMFALGTVIGFVFGGPILRAIGAMTKFGGIFRVVGVAARFFAGVIGFAWGVLRVGFGIIFRIAGLIGRVLVGALRLGGGAFRAIGNAAAGAARWISTKFNGVVGFIRSLPGKIGSAAKGMFDGIKNAFRAAINFIIMGWNGLEFKIPEVDTHIPGVGKVGGMTLGVPDIPLLAQGGVVSGRGSWITGDAGPELNTFLGGGKVRVDPLPAFGGSAVPASDLASSRTGGTVVAKVYLGRRQIAEAVAEEADDELAAR